METQVFSKKKLNHLRHIWDCKHLQGVSTDKSAGTREKILMAAFDEIYTHGFQAASVNNILKNTGATKGALYHHFGSKKELGLAVLDEVIYASYRASQVEPLNVTDDPVTTMTELLVGSLAQMTDEDVHRGCALNNLAQEMSPIDADFRERIRQAYRELQDALEQALERGKAVGNIDVMVDSSSVALLLIAALGGGMGMAKNMQSLDALVCCVKGLTGRMDTLRPSP